MTKKSAWKVSGNRPLADFAPTIILKAKDFATEITLFNSRQHRHRVSTHWGCEFDRPEPIQASHYSSAGKGGGSILRR